MKKQLKKAIATVTLGAFSVMACVPAYANNIESVNENVQINDYQEIKVEYNENGELEKEIVMLGETLVYRIIDDTCSVAISLNTDGKGDVAINNYSEDGQIEYGRFNVNSSLSTTNSVSLLDNNEIENLFLNILQEAKTGKIELETLVIMPSASTYAVPTDHYNEICIEILEADEEAECTREFLTSKSTSNIRASLYKTVEYRINNKANIMLAAGLTAAAISTLISIPTSVAIAVLSFGADAAGNIVLSKDSVLTEYQVTVTELKSVECDGHVDYEAIRSNHAHAGVGDNNGNISASVQFYDEDFTCDESLFHDNDALLDKGIDLHQRLCL